MKKMKKISRKELSTISGAGPGGCHMNGNSAYCWSDCDCTFGSACEMADDGNPGSCIHVGFPGGGGGTTCNPPSICEEQPY